MDWTFDIYVEDVNKYGEENIDNIGNYNAYFIAHLKNSAKMFLIEWKEQHDGRLFDGIYVGDAFAARISDWFSDFYKDTYGQRPHLPMWYYIHLLGLPMQEDVSRTFCSSPIEDAIEMAKEVRHNF